MHRFKFAVVAMLWVVMLAPGAWALTAEEIMARVDENLYYGEAYMVSDMVIRSGRREMTKTMEIWMQEENALVEFTNPGDRGTKYLKMEDQMWIFFPDADDLVLISGHMLKQGFMGSDMSYEDMMVTEKFTDLYEVVLEDEDEVDGRSTWVLRAEAKPEAEVSYAIRKMWVDQEHFYTVREELFALSGRLLKTSQVEEVRDIDGRMFPVVVTMEDVLKRDSSTTLTVREIEFDVEIAADLFSLQSLMR